MSYFDAYDSTGGQTFSSGSPITLNLDTERQNPSGSPYTLDTSDQLTIDTDGDYLFIFRAQAQWNTTASSTLPDGFTVTMQTDTGSGFADVTAAQAGATLEPGVTASPSNINAPATATCQLIHTVAANDVFRWRIQGVGNPTWETVADGSAVTVLRVDDLTTSATVGMSDNRIGAYIIAAACLAVEAGNAFLVAGAVENFLGTTSGFTGDEVADAQTLLTTLRDSGDFPMSVEGAYPAVQRAIKRISAYNSTGGAS